MKKIKRVYWIPFLAAFVGALSFAAYTQHAWEDWYITYRVAKNLATGNGLVYQAGEHIHVFTSVLGTLIPALLNFITFNHSDDLVLWLFRILNSVLLGFSAVLLTKVARKWFSWIPSMVMLVGVFVVDTKTVDFSINGMETAYVVFSLSLFLYLVSFYSIDKLKVKLGATWALLEYSRPDGIVYVAILMVALLLFLEEKKQVLKTLVVSGLIGALLFSPWFVFSLLYYGTVIPHSIIAKGALVDYGFAEVLTRIFIYFKSYLLFQYSALDVVFSPPYSYWFDMPVLMKIGKVIAFVSSLIWVLPRIRAVGRMASFAFFCFLLYLSVFAPVIFPWYVPGATLLALTGFAFLVDAFLDRMKQKGSKRMPVYGWSICGAFVAYMLALTFISAHQFRWMEAVNERAGRQQLGLWLKANAKSDRETVFLECAGYIGFYSGLKLYDFPGMTSDEMVRARRLLRTDDGIRLFKYLKPDWLVLRPEELAHLWSGDSLFLKSNYTPRQIFDASDKIDQISFRPYDGYFRYDSKFFVLRRND